MTARQRMDAEDQRQELFAAAGWCCVVCGGSLSAQGVAQLAHRVPKRESMLMKWGPEVINSPMNMVPVCSLRCNDAISLGTVSLKAKALLERIMRIQTGSESMPDIREYYTELREEFRERRER